MAHTYRGHEIDVVREEHPKSGAYGYKMYCTVDGEAVTSATDIERRGAQGPEDGGYRWATQLERYCEGFVDGKLSH